MARKDIRTDGRSVPLTHHSSRGRVQRNAGNFTRGSQLITHEMLMWFAGAKLPLLLWFFAFVAAWFVIMSVRLDEHGFQLICMKLYAMLWDWIGLDPNKRVNVALPSGEVMRTIMPYVPHIPDVIRAWSVAMRGVLGALLVSIFVAIPLAIWFPRPEVGPGGRTAECASGRSSCAPDRFDWLPSNRPLALTNC